MKAPKSGAFSCQPSAVSPSQVGLRRPSYQRSAFSCQLIARIFGFDQFPETLGNPACEIDVLIADSR